MVKFRTLNGRRGWCRRLVPLVGTVAVVALDQGVKLVVLATRPDASVIPGFFSVTFGTNTGMAFGLFRGFPLGVTLLTLGVTIGILVYLVRVAPGASRLGLTALSVLLGGAIGNLVDRFRLGYVVDYLDVYVGQYHWPAFNLADSAITVSAGLLVLTLRKRSSHAPVVGPAAPARDTGRSG